MNSKNLNNGTEVLQDTELLNTQSNAENTNNIDFSKNFDFKPLEDYPVVQVKQIKGDKEVFYGMIGQGKVTHEFKSEAELLKSLKGIGIKDWLQFTAILHAYIDTIVDEKMKGGNK